MSLRPDIREHRRKRVEQLLDVPRRSYATRGIEAAEGMRADYTARRGAFRFRVFDREGQPCEDCGSTIVREEHGTRRLYRCPRCQP